jgi:hypothetical protein
MAGKRGARWRRVWIEQMAAGQPWVLEDAAAELATDARILARQAWAKGRIAALKRAQKALDDAWMAQLAPYDDLDDEEELPEMAPPPEEAVFQTIWEEIHAVTDHDRWPRHLHWVV